MKEAFERLKQNLTPDDVVNWLTSKSPVIAVSEDKSDVLLVSKQFDKDGYVLVDVDDYIKLFWIDVVSRQVEYGYEMHIDEESAYEMALDIWREDYQQVLDELYELVSKRLAKVQEVV